MIWIGTSGYNYPEWKGNFYPASLPASKMLAYYAERFPTVEINYTFYRLPTEKLVQGWAAGTPSPYKLTLKAPRRITHDRKLRDTGDLVRAFCQAASALGPKLGVLLFQLAPTFKIDLAVFDAFLAELPKGRARRVRVPERIMARRRRVRAPEGQKPGALHRRQRHSIDADDRDGQLRLLPVARRGLPGGGSRQVGRRGPRTRSRNGKTPSSTSSTRKRGRAPSSRGS